MASRIFYTTSKDPASRLILYGASLALDHRNISLGSERPRAFHFVTILPFSGAWLSHGLTYKGFMISHPSSLLVFSVLKSKSSKTLSVMGRMLLDLSRQAFAASFNASISASSR